jgi:hypothetical protein
MTSQRSNRILVDTHHARTGAYAENFNEVIRQWLREAPWLLVSLVIHLVLGLVITNIDWQTLEEDPNRIIQADYEQSELEPLPEEEVEEEEEEIEEIDEIIEDPVVNDEVIVEEEILEDDPIEDPFPKKNLNDIIGVGGGWSGKFGGKYRRRQSARGGGRTTQRAVDSGLDWLARHQDPEGYWDADAFDMQCRESRCMGPGAALNDVGVTGLALLAFLGAGNTPMQGPHRKVVKSGVRYLCNVQDQEDGCLAPKSHEHFMYNHAIGCLALTEAYGLSQWPVLKKHARRAIEFVHESKNPGRAWRYNMGYMDPSEQNDTSVTGWMIMCLASAKDFSLPFNKKDIEDALMFIDEMTDPVTGRTGYIRRGDDGSRQIGDERIWPAEKVETMTAVAMLSRVFCANILDDFESQEEMLEKGAALLAEKPPRWDMEEGTIDYYYWYYGSYAMFQMGGRQWERWKNRMVDAVVEHQRTEGCERGSWDPRVDPWGDLGGRIYSTALCTLCLEVFYRYDDILGARF